MFDKLLERFGKQKAPDAEGTLVDIEFDNGSKFLPWLWDPRLLPHLIEFAKREEYQSLGLKMSILVSEGQSFRYVKKDGSKGSTEKIPPGKALIKLEGEGLFDENGKLVPMFGGTENQFLNNAMRYASNKLHDEIVG